MKQLSTHINESFAGKLTDKQVIAQAGDDYAKVFKTLLDAQLKAGEKDNQRTRELVSSATVDILRMGTEKKYINEEQVDESLKLTDDELSFVKLVDKNAQWDQIM